MAPNPEHRRYNDRLPGRRGLLESVHGPQLRLRRWSSAAGRSATSARFARPTALP